MPSCSHAWMIDVPGATSIDIPLMVRVGMMRSSEQAVVSAGIAAAHAPLRHRQPDEGPANPAEDRPHRRDQEADDRAAHEIPGGILRLELTLGPKLVGVDRLDPVRL